MVLFGAMAADSSAADSPPASPRGLLVVCNKYDRTLGVVDPEAGKQIAVIPLSGVTGHEVAASPDGTTAYVPIYGSGGVGRPGTDGRTMDVIDLATKKRLSILDFGRPVRPHDAKFGPDGLLYVTTELTNTVDVIDPKTMTIVAKISTGQPESHMIAITRNGKRAYTSNAHAGTVSVLDLVMRQPIAQIPISPYAQRISLSLDDKLAFTADQTAPRLAVIDTATNEIKTWVELPGRGYGTAPTPDGLWLLIAMPEANQVAVLDLQTMKVARTIDVAADPQLVRVRPDGGVAFVSAHTGKVSVVNLKTWEVEKIIEVGNGADGLAWAPEGLSD